MNKKIILAITLLLCYYPLVYCETIKLKNGNSVEGAIVEKNDTFVKVDVSGVTLTYYLDEISDIGTTKANLEKEAKKIVSYKVTKKFYLKALEDTHYLKFCMPLPQREALRQNITDANVFPKINAFIKDDYGNDIPIFYFESIKSGTNAIVGVTYTVNFEAELFTVNPSLIPDQYPAFSESFKQYLNSEKDIDIKNPLIQEKAQALTGSIKNPYQKAKALYDFVTSYIQYDYAIAQSVMEGGIYEPRKPLDTLQDKKGICYDIAKLYVNFCRASGIPARVVLGIAFEPKKDTKNYVERIGHAWTEIYLPKYGWLAVDPTFGIVKKDAFFCFNNTSHIAEEYGLANAKEFGSLEKGWALQVRSQTELTQSPLAINEEIEIEQISN